MIIKTLRSLGILGMLAVAPAAVGWWDAAHSHGMAYQNLVAMTDVPRSSSVAQCGAVPFGDSTTTAAVKLPLGSVLAAIPLRAGWSWKMSPSLRDLRVSHKAGAGADVVRQLREGFGLLFTEADCVIGVATDPAISARLASSTAEDWSVSPGQLLSAVVAEWGARAGWSLEWLARGDVPIRHSAEFVGDFRSALTTVLDGVASPTGQLTAVWYPANKVVKVDLSLGAHTEIARATVGDFRSYEPLSSTVVLRRAVKLTPGTTVGVALRSSSDAAGFDYNNTLSALGPVEVRKVGKAVVFASGSSLSDAVVDILGGDWYPVADTRFRSLAVWHRSRERDNAGTDLIARPGDPVNASVRNRPLMSALQDLMPGWKVEDMVSGSAPGIDVHQMRVSFEPGNRTRVQVLDALRAETGLFFYPYPDADPQPVLIISDKEMPR